MPKSLKIFIAGDGSRGRFIDRSPEHLLKHHFDAEKLASLATSILQDLPTYKRMAKAARTLAVPDAADRVCAAIEATLSPS